MSERTTTVRFSRRRVLRTLNTAGIVAIAGCLGGDEDQVDDDPAEETESTDDVDEPDDDVEEGDDENTEEVADDADDAAAQFGEIVQFTDSYGFEVEHLEEGDALQWSGRVHGDDSYVRMEEGNEVIEIYTIGQETYFVQAGECFMTSPEEVEGIEEDDADEPTIEDHESEVVEHPELEAVGRDAIDGEEVFVFELSADEAAEHETDVTYYVSVETGYLRRVESEDTVMDFHSWGEADPIEPPDGECVDIDDWGDDDLPTMRLW